jgi:hypothetical protein
VTGKAWGGGLRVGSVVGVDTEARQYSYPVPHHRNTVADDHG